MVMVSKYGHTFQIGLYLKIDQLPNMACFQNMVMVSKYGHTFQIGLYLKIDQLPNMACFPNMVISSKLSNQNDIMFSSYCHMSPKQ